VSVWAWALIGEVVELAAGAAGAKRSGASRRAMLLALVAQWLAACWALSSQCPSRLSDRSSAPWAEERWALLSAPMWERRPGTIDPTESGRRKRRLIGRLLGTAGKLLIGVVLFVVIAVDALF